MKTIVFIRHAKSSWADMSLQDHERPLNKRGLRDAPFMSKMLAGKGTKVDKIISSPANRALTTAQYFADAFGIDQNKIQVEKSIYEAYPEDVMEIINLLEDNLNIVLIFGHNPTFTALANKFSEDYISNVPTCGIVECRSFAKKWEKLDESNTKVVNFHFPKQYFD